MNDNRITFADLAQAVGGHYKSAQRWVYEGRLPKSRDKALRVARYLGVEADWLWPALPEMARLPHLDLVNVYDLIRDV